ncbi:MAG: response regulator transcription factor [Spirochaetales bacterium]|nr:response regulator transcription factor [Spirochaetales bacterium]
MSLLLKTLIADDERFARERLAKLLSDFPIFKIEWQVKDGDEVAEILRREKVDAAFLDINMPGESVFDTLAQIDPIPLVVFQTAYSEFAVKAFQVNAVDYLLKPIDRELLSKTAERLRIISEQSTALSYKVTHIPLRIGNSIRLIPYEGVMCILSKDGFSYIHTDADKIVSEQPLNFYEELLDNTVFFRASRSGIVHLDKIKKIIQADGSNYIIQLNDNSQLPLSRRKAKDLRALLKI